MYPVSDNTLSKQERGLQDLRTALTVAESTSRSMRANRSYGTNLELRVRRALWNAGLRGYRVNDHRWPGTPDIYVPKARLCIFVHGCFWHGCRKCNKNTQPKLNAEFWAAKLAATRNRDEYVQSSLRSMNMNCLTIWECDTRQDLDQVIRDIINLVRSPTAQKPCTP